MSATPTRLVECVDCGDTYELSTRREYEYRRTGKPILCAFWLERYSREEITQLAASIWPNLAAADARDPRVQREWLLTCGDTVDALGCA